MDERYEAFCMASPVFYDAMHSEQTAGTSYAVAKRPLPEHWMQEDQDDWLVFAPKDVDIPAQGWKIHISSGLDNAEAVLEHVWDYCVPRDIEFKFLRSRQALWLRSSKYAPRGYSGKLVTIYPPDDGVCERILLELGELLDGQPGPYILSDLRWNNGPMYVRYGGFTEQHCVSDDGQVVLAIEDADGKLVPDRRDPVFYVPPWVKLPEFLVPQLAARNAVTVGELPYSIASVMHFSNGGGIYRGRDNRDGREVVLKEGRPLAGLDGFGDDAVRRVAREIEVLEVLAGVPGIPQLYDRFQLGDHSFMVTEFIDGMPLRRAMVQTYPMIDVAATEADYAKYTAWAMRMYAQVEVTVLAMHERGVVYGDLHLFNILLREDQSTVLLDFEVSTSVKDNARPGLGNQGFAPPAGFNGVDVDRYGLACLRIALFMPVTQILWLSREKVNHLVSVIEENFPVPHEFLAPAIEMIAPTNEPSTDRTSGGSRERSPAVDLSFDVGKWPQMRTDMARAIIASATPDRQDRLFPGDIEQFRFGALGLAYGASGILYTLDVTGAGRHPELEEWLVRQAKVPPSGTLIGVYDGMHGAGFALEHLGYRQEALDAIDMAQSDGWDMLGLDLFGGISGIGLNLAHMADRTGESKLREASLHAASLAAERLGDVESVSDASSREHPFAGLMRGSCGPALLFMRMYEDTGDTAWLDKAAVALRQDLKRCVLRENGSMEVNEGWRTMPYLAVGSVGVGYTLDRYLEYREDEQFSTASSAILQAARLRMYVQPGLFTGSAGILLYLAGRSGAQDQMARQVRGLSLHTLPFSDGVAFPGEQLLRLSMDLATGTTGVLLAVAAGLHDQPVHLPLLRHPKAPTP